MSYNYSGYVTDLANLLVVPQNDPGFMTALPNIIDDAEQRIYRELNLLSTSVRDSSANLTANSRNFVLPQTFGIFKTVTGVNVVTPVGTTTSNGTRNPLQPTWRNMLDFLFPSEVGSGVPSKFAMLSDQTMIVGQSPDQSYNAEVIGTIRPTPLSATNTTTYLTQFLPDLFIAASMMFGSGYQLNFSATSDNPAQSQNWENVYEARLASANAEELRKRYNQDLESRMRP
jgi:hypothetical protein